MSFNFNKKKESDKLYYDGALRMRELRKPAGSENLSEMNQQKNVKNQGRMFK